MSTLRSSSYFQNIVPLFNPFLISTGTVTGHIPDPSGTRDFSIEVTVFSENHTSLTQVGYYAFVFSFFRRLLPNSFNKVLPSTFSFYYVFPRISRWADVSLPVLDQFVFVTGLLQGISVINGHGGKCPCILIVELSFIPAPSFPDQAPPETSACLNRFRQTIGFGSPITPSRTPGTRPRPLLLKVFRRLHGFRLQL